MFDPEFPNNNIMNTAIDITPRVCFPIPTIQYTTLYQICRYCSSILITMHDNIVMLRHALSFDWIFFEYHKDA